ncbi:MAG: hypothetical protein JG781_1128 [Peptococcaceae bacterium]|nr:hypothetical protein [Peptococcaceae bacterium]
MRMKKITTLLFDLDGVLIDSFADVADALNYAFKAVGAPEKSYEEIKSIFGYGAKNLVADGLGEKYASYFNEAMVTFKERYLATCLNKTKLYPGVEEVLNHFKDKNLAVVTNKSESFSRYILEQLGVGQYFRYIVGPESVSCLKPHPEGILLLLERFRADAAESVMIGDFPSDMAAGKAAGTLTCGAYYGFGDRTKLKGAQADYYIETIAELKDLFF